MLIFVGDIIQVAVFSSEMLLLNSVKRFILVLSPQRKDHCSLLELHCWDMLKSMQQMLRDLFHLRAILAIYWYSIQLDGGKQLILITILKLSVLSLIAPAILCSELGATEKLRIEGNTLYYSTSDAKEAIDQEISWDDVESFEAILKKQSNITLLQLNSRGGEIEAAMHLADVIIDYELNTHIDGECSSACVLIFLGGEKRSLARGSWIGFHKSSWASNHIKDYYTERKEDEGWVDEYEFAEWLNDDTQKSILRDLEYLIERGVHPAFAIKTLRADNDDMWYPRRKEMVASGIITED